MSASRRTGSYGASRLIMMTSARRHTAISRNSRAARSAPSKCGTRAAQPGKRTTPSRSTACHTFWRISVLVIATRSRREASTRMVRLLQPLSGVNAVCAAGRHRGDAAPCEDEEARMRHHAVVGPYAPVAHGPGPEQGFEGLDQGECPMPTQSIHDLLHLEHRGEE